MEARTSVTHSIYKSWLCLHGLKRGCWHRDAPSDSRLGRAGPGRQSVTGPGTRGRGGGHAFSLALTGRGSWEVRPTLPLLPLHYQGGTGSPQDARGCPEGRAEPGLGTSGVTETNLCLVKQTGKPGGRRKVTGPSVGSGRSDAFKKLFIEVEFTEHKISMLK